MNVRKCVRMTAVVAAMLAAAAAGATVADVTTDDWPWGAGSTGHPWDSAPADTPWGP